MGNRCDLKSEIRGPKSETNPNFKSEIRTHYFGPSFPSTSIGRPQNGFTLFGPRISAFGFRLSAFERRIPANTAYELHVIHRLFTARTLPNCLPGAGFVNLERAFVGVGGQSVTET